MTRDWALFHNQQILSVKVKVLFAQSCLTLCDPMGCSTPGSSVHGILQARILEWVAIRFSRESSWPGNWTRSPSLQADSSPSEPLGKPQLFLIHFLRQFQKEHHISYYFLEEKLKYFRILHYFKYFKILKGIQSCCWFPPAFHVVFLRER